MNGKKAVVKNRSAIFQIIFIVLFGICIIASLVAALQTDGASFAESLFHAETVSLNKDFFMDFFNSIRDAGDMQVYEKGVIYPPLANLLFLFFSKFLSVGLVGSSFDLRVALQLNQQAIILYLFFSLICIVAFSVMIKEYLSKTKNTAAVVQALSFGIIFMYPFYYCIERGNIVLLSMILSAFFVFFHDSTSRIVREVSYIMLALAAGLKIYPAFYGLILLQEKRYKAAIKTVIYGILFFFVPFLFYDYGKSLITFIQNIMVFSTENKSHYSFGSTSIINLFYYLGDKYVSIGQVVFILTELIAAVFVFIAPKKWHKYLLMSYMIININSVSSTYASVFMIIPFIIFLSSETEKDRSDWVYLLLFSLLLLPLPCFYYNKEESLLWFFNRLHIVPSYSVNKIFAWAAVQFSFFFVSLECIVALLDRKKIAEKTVSQSAEA